MQKHRLAALAGAATLAVVGVQIAASQERHQLKVALPDGSVARIAYAGAVAPEVSVVPSLHFVPVGLIRPFEAPSFDRLERDAEQIDHAAQVSATVTLDGTSFGKLPVGTVSYSFLRSGDGKDSCYRSVQVTSYGAGAQPKIVSSGAGNCAADERAQARIKFDATDWSAMPLPQEGATRPARPTPPPNIA